MSEEEQNMPWSAESLAIYDARGRMVAQLGVSADRCFSPTELEEFARRIVACVNACAGVRTSTLEAVPLNQSTKDMVERIEAAEQQRDALLAALKRLEAAFVVAVGDKSPFAKQALEPVRAAIAAAT